MRNVAIIIGKLFVFSYKCAFPYVCNLLGCFNIYNQPSQSFIIPIRHKLDCSYRSSRDLCFNTVYSSLPRAQNGPTSFFHAFGLSDQFGKQCIIQLTKAPDRRYKWFQKHKFWTPDSSAQILIGSIFTTFLGLKLFCSRALLLSI